MVVPGASACCRWMKDVCVLACLLLCMLRSLLLLVTVHVPLYKRKEKEESVKEKRKRRKCKREKKKRIYTRVYAKSLVDGCWNKFNSKCSAFRYFFYCISKSQQQIPCMCNSNPITASSLSSYTILLFVFVVLTWVHHVNSNIHSICHIYDNHPKRINLHNLRILLDRNQLHPLPTRNLPTWNLPPWIQVRLNGIDHYGSRIEWIFGECNETDGGLVERWRCSEVGCGCDGVGFGGDVGKVAV